MSPPDEQPVGSLSLYTSAGTSTTLSHPCQPLPIHFPFTPCSCHSIHMVSLPLWMLQGTSLNTHTLNRVVSVAGRPSLTSRQCLPHPQVPGSEQKDLGRGDPLGKVGSGAIPALHSAADIDECANETLCGSHGFCENSEGSFRCLCDRGYESSPSGHYCIGESPAITLPVSQGHPSANARPVSPLCDSSWGMDGDCMHAWRISDMDRTAHGGKPPHPLAQ